jgi:hypothetical protein
LGIFGTKGSIVAQNPLTIKHQDCNIALYLQRVGGEQLGKRRINEFGCFIQRKNRNTGKGIRQETDPGHKNDKGFVEYRKKVQALEEKKIRLSFIPASVVSFSLSAEG